MRFLTYRTLSFLSDGKGTLGYIREQMFGCGHPLVGGIMGDSYRVPWSSIPSVCRQSQLDTLSPEFLQKVKGDSVVFYVAVLTELDPPG